MSGKTFSDEHLVSAALVGTGKRAAPPLEMEHPAEQLLTERTGLSPESQLLLRAGAREIYQLAGMRPEAVPPLPPAPADEGMPANSRVVELLQAAFSPQALPLLPEFLDLLQSHRIPFPARLLPIALNCHEPIRRSRLRPVLGHRARWLARLNPDWNWLIEDDHPIGHKNEWKRRFEEDSFAERVQALRQFRQHNPAEARELLQSSIAAEKGDQKRKLLECLREGLSLDDETFLQQFQHDRGKKVRDLVCELLASLPDSQISQKNCQRVAACFQWMETAAGRGQLDFVLPSELPDDWKRDGFNVLPDAGLDSRTALLRELIRRTPLDFWTTHFQRSPEELLLATEWHDDGHHIRSGWAEAIGTFRAATTHIEAWERALWAEAIRLRRLGRSELPELITTLGLLAEKLSFGELEAAVTRLLREFPDVANLPLESWLARLPGVWSPELSSAYLQTTRTLLRTRSDVAIAEWCETLLRAAMGLSPSCFDEALQPWSLNSSAMAPWVATQVEALLRQMGEVIRLRREFHREVQKSVAACPVDIAPG